MQEARPRLLYAEDETLIAGLVEGILTEAGFETIVAHDGEQAAQMLAEHRDDLAGFVTDVQLGRGPNGWDLARRARASNPRLPVIYTTGDSAHEWTAEGVPHSLAIAKPFVEAQLLTALAVLVEDPLATIAKEPTPMGPARRKPGSPAAVDEPRAAAGAPAARVSDFGSPSGSSPSAPRPTAFTDEKLASIAMSIYRARRRRGKFFEASLFVEPAWDMLLDLFVASVHGRKVSASSLYRAAGVSESTGPRWVELLESQGLVRRRFVAEDGDLRLVEISDNGFEAMGRYVLDGVAKYEVPVPD